MYDDSKEDVTVSDPLAGRAAVEHDARVELGAVHVLERQLRLLPNRRASRDQS